MTTAPGTIENHSLHGSTALVTGATSGLGLATARGLARCGAHVVMGARTRARGEDLASRIRGEIPHAAVSVADADLSTQAGVRRLADQVRARHRRLDVLVNNAGAVRAARHVTTDGIEWTLAVNHLAPFLLTRLLLPLLGTHGRVVMVTSDAHRDVSLDLDDLQSASSYDPLVAYRRSKLANILFAWGLSRRVPGLSVFAVAPGMVATDIVREAPAALRSAWAARSRPAAEAAAGLVHVAGDPALAGTTRRYFSEEREMRPSDEAQSEQLSDSLWEASATLTGTPASPAALTE